MSGEMTEGAAASFLRRLVQAARSYEKTCDGTDRLVVYETRTGLKALEASVSVNLFLSCMALLSFSPGDEGFHVWQGTPYWISSWMTLGVPSESSPSSW
jgi:hypothetical protein